VGAKVGLAIGVIAGLVAGLGIVISAVAGLFGGALTRKPDYRVSKVKVIDV